MTTQFFGDTALLTGRSLRHIMRSPDTIITTTIMPIAIMLLFVYGARRPDPASGPPWWSAVRPPARAGAWPGRRPRPGAGSHARGRPAQRCRRIGRRRRPGGRCWNRRRGPPGAMAGPPREMATGTIVPAAGPPGSEQRVCPGRMGWEGMVNTCRQRPRARLAAGLAGIGSGHHEPVCNGCRPEVQGSGGARPGRVLLAFGVLAALHAVTVPPFLATDERSHTGYGLLVAQGRLPDPDHPGATAAGAGGRPADLHGQPSAALLRPDRGAAAARAGERAPDGWSGRCPAPHRARRRGRDRRRGRAGPGVAPAPAANRPGRGRGRAAAAVVCLPLGLVHNDALGFATATATLAVAALVLVRGPSARRLAALAAAAAAAALTRASGLPFAVLAMLAAGLACLVHVRRPPLAGSRQLHRGVTAGLPRRFAIAVDSNPPRREGKMPYASLVCRARCRSVGHRSLRGTRRGGR